MAKHKPWSFMEDAIQAQLRRGEHVVWRGQPEPTYVLTVFLVRAAICWSIIVASIAGPIYLSWWLLIPALPAFLIAAWRLDEARITAQKDDTTRYTVTDRRALITQENPSRAVETFVPGEIEQVAFRNCRFGVTDVLFNHEFRGAKFGPDAHIKVISTGFLRIKDREGAREALEAISDVEPRHRIPPGKLKIINITPAILK